MQHLKQYMLSGDGKLFMLKLLEIILLASNSKIFKCVCFNVIFTVSSEIQTLNDFQLPAFCSFIYILTSIPVILEKGSCTESIICTISLKISQRFLF